VFGFDGVLGAKVYFYLCDIVFVLIGDSVVVEVLPLARLFVVEEYVEGKIGKECARVSDFVELAFDVSVLEARCPVCAGDVAENLRDVLICPECLSLYHSECVRSLLETSSGEVCWVCSKVSMKEFI